MENIESASTTTGDTRLPLLSRWARAIVLSQLRQLGSGQLTVREPGIPPQVFGDGDERWPAARIDVHDHSVWRDLLTGGGIGAAEAYVAGDWSTRT